MIDWPSLIKYLRKQMMLSQTEMAEKLDVAFGTLNRWENNHFEPNYKIQRIIKKLCIKYGVDIDNFRKEQ